jgi:hypothetical protein
MLVVATDFLIKSFLAESVVHHLQTFSPPYMRDGFVAGRKVKST